MASHRPLTSSLCRFELQFTANSIKKTPIEHLAVTSIKHLAVTSVEHLVVTSIEHLAVVSF
eukprot:m.30049 g.30049  ORF g.30049 m.30049 type:complete len:61 (+) comp9609_c0_seq10:963-1145(+)